MLLKKVKENKMNRDGLDHPDSSSSPRIQTPKEKPEDLIEKYKYNPDTQEVQTTEVVSKKSERVQKHSSAKELKPEKITLFDLSHRCRNFVAIKLYEPKEVTAQKLYDLEVEYLFSKIDMFVDTSNPDNKIILENEIFRDEFYKYRGIILLPEELKPASGFLREYFNIEEIIILNRSGQLEKTTTGYCDFWLDLDKIKNTRIQDLDVPTDSERCKHCLMGNYGCAI